MDIKMKYLLPQKDMKGLEDMFYKDNFKVTAYVPYLFK